MPTAAQYTALSVLLAVCVGSPIQAQPEPAPVKTTDLVFEGIGPHTVKLFLSTNEVAPQATPGEFMPLIVYFHGGGENLIERLGQRGVYWPVLNARFPGLSSTYRKPFEGDPELFGAMLARVASELGVEPAQLDPVVVASFSAGYGASRQLLKTPEARPFIDAIVTVDSMYASYAPDGGAEQGIPLATNMIPFRDYAAEAVQPDGDAVFVISHSYLPPGSYAGTHETAADLLRHVGLLDDDGRVVGDAVPGEALADRLVPDDMQAARLAVRNGLAVVGCEGVDAQAHIDHLRNAATWVSLAVEMLEARRARRPDPSGGRID